MEITTEPQERTITVPLEARETDWQFAPGRSIRGYGLNGHVPGPLIEAKVGDALVVELTNRLAEPTTIHWHGLRVPAEMDGTEMVQRPVEPQGRLSAGASSTLPTRALSDSRSGVGRSRSSERAAD